MDKFGIFNLLSSLLGNFTQRPEETGQGANPPAPMSALPNTKPNADSLAEKRAAFAPLQNSMLSTMKSHDEFIKRVKERNHIH